MYSALQLAIKYAGYYITAENGNGHGVHSPFVFDFIKNVLKDKRHFYVYDEVEQLRNDLKNNDTVLQVEDFGAGSVTGAAKQRTVAAIVTSAAKPKKFGQLLFRIVQHYQPTQIVELGTSFGISTAYMAASQNIKITTLEGAPAIAAMAKNNFEYLNRKNISIVTGNFNDTLPVVLQQLENVDMAFIDGNHRLQPTLQYFTQLLPYTNEFSIIIFDDIHWSAEMEEAWAQIKNNPSVTLTIDLFFIGLVFFRKDFKVKQHFTLRF